MSVSLSVFLSGARNDATLNITDTCDYSDENKSDQGLMRKATPKYKLCVPPPG